MSGGRWIGADNINVLSGVGARGLRGQGQAPGMVDHRKPLSGETRPVRGRWGASAGHRLKRDEG
ncbi:hypothetical protein GCM10009603_34840 [Nocardiopsis exhalans]